MRNFIRLNSSIFLLIAGVSLDNVGQALADTESIGPNGINSSSLPYTGSGISIG
jgi:hypothetical protein